MDIRVFKLPLPGLGIESVNVYLVDNILVDVGLYSARTLHVLVRGLRASGVNVCDVEGVVVTHFHVDHLSLLPLLLDMCGFEAYMGWKDLDVIRRGAVEFVKGVLEVYRLNGVPVEELELITDLHPIMKFRDVYAVMLRDAPIKPLRDGDRLAGGSLRVLEVPGHTPGSIALVNDYEGVAFVGDTLIDGITPHVVAHRESQDPLGEHLSSLRRLASMKLKTAHPGHRNPIGDPAVRALELVRFHEDRLNEILGLIKERPRTGYEVARGVKWRVRYESWDQYPPVERFFAIGEAIAHLIHLRELGIADYHEEKGVMKWYALNP